MAERFDLLLWDVDGTLLDFLAAERAAVRSLFAEFGLGKCSGAMIERYSAINRLYWERLERGELPKGEILVRRFKDFFEEYGLDTSLAGAFNEAYQLRLGDTIVYLDGSLELVSSLRGRVRQFAVSNGTVAAQTRKLCASGFDRLLDGVFLSEDIGFEKPDPRFFAPVLAAAPDVPPERILIVGDSLTSDMAGGINAGIKTCWYNPSGAPAPAAPIDYTIRRLGEIEAII